MSIFESRTVAQLEALPSEIQESLIDSLARVGSYAKRFGAGYTDHHMVREQDSVNFMANYFNDDRFRDMAITESGIPLTVQAIEEGVRVIVGIAPNVGFLDTVDKEVIKNWPHPYAISTVSFEETESLSLLQIEE
jgi:hypothetical protein